MKLPRTFLFLSVISLILPASLEARSWKEVGSDRTLEGEYSRTEGDNVVIIRAGGGAVKVPLAKLSDEDKKFVADQPVIGTDAAFKWETDFEVAKKRAKAEHKKILADFTGSDWCGWCIKLKKEVFDQPKFKEYAKKNLVMLELDFPQNKKLPAKEKAQNEKLSTEYKISGYPTILLLDENGKQVAATGYQSGGPESYVEHIKGLLKK